VVRSFTHYLRPQLSTSRPSDGAHNDPEEFPDMKLRSIFGVTTYFQGVWLERKEVWIGYVHAKT